MIQRQDAQSDELKAVIQIIDEVHKLYPRMELSQLRVLLRVLEKPGIRTTDLGKVTGLAKSSLSRATRVLGAGDYTRDGDGSAQRGHNLITTVSDPFDSRANLVAPTALGRRLAEQIKKHIGECCGKSAG